MNWIIPLVLSMAGFVPVTYLLTNAYLSRRREHVRRVPPGPTGDVTIVIPVHGETAERFRATIRSACGQGCRVIVVGDGCDEPYRSLTRAEGGEFVGLPERGGKKRALAAGLPYVTTPFVLFLDSDTALPEQAVARLSTYFAPEVGGVGANLLHTENPSIAAGCAEFVERAREVVLRATSSRGNVLYLDGACMMFRTELIRPFVASEEFQHLRVLGRETPLGDDWQLTDYVLSQGFRTVKAYDVGAVTQPPATLGAFVRQNVRWMRSSWIRLGRYLRGAGPSDPGLFYRLELIGTYALPLVTFALVIARFPLFLHVVDGLLLRAYLATSHGVAIAHSATRPFSWYHVFLPVQTVSGLIGTGAFLGAVANRLPPHRRLRTLACGALGSSLLLVTAIYGLATIWRASRWRGETRGGRPTGPIAPAAGGGGFAAGGPYLRR